jgi:uncharacterized phage protein (TIGR01671 family)
MKIKIFNKITKKFIAPWKYATIDSEGNIRPNLTQFEADGEYPIDDDLKIITSTESFDKNGEEIWEGDIIENVNYIGYDKEMITDFDIKTKIKKGWVNIVKNDIFTNDDGNQISGFLFGQYSENYIIIGNIYTTPELLK